MNLPSLRQQIDAIDRRLLRLLNARATLAIRVGRVKQARGAPILDRQREVAILRHMAAGNPGPLSRAAIQDIYRSILRQSRKLEAAANDLHRPPSTVGEPQRPSTVHRKNQWR